MRRTRLFSVLLLALAASAETLPNGIVLPDPWPPRTQDPKSRAPMPVPYLKNPPAVIPIDAGRQLFVDDFLIERATLRRTFHRAEKYAANPILKAETERELHAGFRPGACPHSGGAWFDPQDNLYKLWYMTGWYGGSAYATSADGVRWNRAVNHIPDPSPELRWGMDHVRLDLFTTDPHQRFKSFHFYHQTEKGGGGRVHTSPDGLSWSKPVATGPSGDRNTFFYNPFRKRWVFSIKTQARDASQSRARNYWEHADFLQGAQWKPEDPVFWIGADDLDEPDPAVGDPPQIYDLDATAYESLMIGIFQIHKGPDNKICQRDKHPKMTELGLGYSRDGFHWHRPDRRAFVPATRRRGDWERAYIHSTGGVMLVDRDRLLFYYAGFSGKAPNGPDMYAGCATGAAFLRRDGFASMDAPAGGGVLETRQVRFNGRVLFVNLNGELTVEVLGENGKTLASSRPASGDSTRTAIVWKDGKALARFSGKPVRFRFRLVRGSLYSFWVSPDSRGHSHGYVAGGGPGFKGPVDSPDGR